MAYDTDPGLFERVPSREEATSASELQQLLADQLSSGQGVTMKAGKDKISIAPALANALVELLGHLGNGRAVKLIPIHSQLTTQQAADLLNISRPFLIKLIERGELKCSKVGRHRRLKAEDVFAYHEKMRSDRDAALTEMVKADIENGMI